MTIEVSEKVLKDLEEASLANGVSVDEFAAQILRKALALRKLNELRAELEPYAKAAGFETDEDFFNAFS